MGEWQIHSDGRRPKIADPFSHHAYGISVSFSAKMSMGVFMERKQINRKDAFLHDCCQMNRIATMAQVLQHIHISRLKDTHKQSHILSSRKSDPRRLIKGVDRLYGNHMCVVISEKPTTIMWKQFFVVVVVVVLSPKQWAGMHWPENCAVIFNAIGQSVCSFIVNSCDCDVAECCTQRCGEKDVRN